MSYRDSLPEAERPAFDEAGTACMASYAEAWAGLWEYADLHGLDMHCVAKRCWFPGRDVQQIQRRLQEIQDAARKRAALDEFGPPVARRAGPR